MTLDRLDQLLAEWRKKVDLIGQNLIELNSHPTYQRLAGISGFPKAELTGITKTRVAPAISAMSDLFQHFDLLLQTIDKATSLRKQMVRFLGSEQKINEIEKILTGPSIILTSVQTPLAQRGLLSTAETNSAIAPEQLLTIMTNTFLEVRDAILAVDAAWLRLEPNLAAAETQILSLQKLADSLGVGESTELSDSRQKIASLRANIESDPLGVSADFDQISLLIKRGKTTLDRLVLQQNQLRDNLEMGHQLLNKLVELNRLALAAFAESREKVSDCSSLQTPLDREQIDALSLWLTRLETKFAENLLTPVSKGLENWMVRAKEYIAAEERVCAANNAPLLARRELRGRLDALKAKALARGLAEDATLTELAQQAKQLLYTRPTPLTLAAELVSQYEKRLNSECERKK